MIQWMRGHRNLIIGGVIILAVLITAFFWGDSTGKQQKNSSDIEVERVEPEHMEASGDLAEQMDTSEALVTDASQTETDVSSQPTESTFEDIAYPSDEAGASGVPSSEVPTTEKPTASTGTETPIQETTEQPVVYNCTISISCATILNNMDKLDSAKSGYVPSDGVILGGTSISFTEGESVYDILRRACSNAGIPLDATGTSAYVRGIDNIYEFDCGQRSGWMYTVNGISPNYGCSAYQVQDGDVIRWSYTCSPGDI
jgi:hypothetical protein